MKTLIFAPHPDDETIGVGGTILKRLKNGDKVAWVIVTALGSENYTINKINNRKKQIKQVHAAFKFSKVFELNFKASMLDTIPIIKLYKKNPIVYLRSDGYAEYKVILGLPGPMIYHFMFSIISKISSLISCRKYILNDKPGEIVAPSQISKQWLIKHKELKIDKLKLLYVGRIRKEKGIYSLLNLIKEINTDLTLSIVGAEKNSLTQITQDNVYVHEVENNEKILIKFYDDHNIFILPSYTEGHPMALLEALSRLRPVIIFKDIEHVVENKKGIFVAERNSSSLLEQINYIKKNYKNIQQEMKNNNLPTKEQFISKFGDLISKSS